MSRDDGASRSRSTTETPRTVSAKSTGPTVHARRLLFGLLISALGNQCFGAKVSRCYSDGCERERCGGVTRLRASRSIRMIDPQTPLLLGSGSPRRREILAGLGIPIRVVTADVDEAVQPSENPDAYLVRVVQAKLVSVSAKSEVHGSAGVLVADTTVIVDGEPIGKPANVEDAVEMLSLLSGRFHEVWTRFAVTNVSAVLAAQSQQRTLSNSEVIAETVRTRVWFRKLSVPEIQAYAATEEGLDKAGAYAIQGIGAFAVSRIEGSYSNVVGLPACEVVLALRNAGILGAFPFRAAFER